MGVKLVSVTLKPAGEKFNSYLTYFSVHCNNLGVESTYLYFSLVTYPILYVVVTFVQLPETSSLFSNSRHDIMARYLST